MSWKDKINTPAYVIDEVQLRKNLSVLKKLCDSTNVQLNYAVKANSMKPVIEIASEYVKGFSVSSYFEAKLCKELGGKDKEISWTSPAIQPEHIIELYKLVDVMNFNSINQFNKYNSSFVRNGLRINPHEDLNIPARYNPCERDSKLGTPIDAFKYTYIATEYLESLSFHVAADLKDFEVILRTVKKLDREIPQLLRTVDSLNLGGGIIVNEKTDSKPFVEAVKLLQDKYGLNVTFEPGSSICANAGSLVVEVLDIIENDDATIAVTDGAAVSQIPEVYQYNLIRPILESSEDGEYKYIVVGSTCLAGDIFGPYSFTEPLKLGDKLTISNSGAYSIVQMSRFNGLDAPNQILRNNDNIQIIKKDSYKDFKSLYV